MKIGEELLVLEHDDEVCENDCGDDGHYVTT